MISFLSMKFRNILSFGNQWTTIDFQKNKNMIIQGTNGSGKSACILDTLSFGLYGRPFRKINKPNLINYKNKKDLVVEVSFSVMNGDVYKIIRGQNPSIFSIYCNDILVNQDAQSRDYQKYLEKEVLRIDFQSFTQIVVLGKATYIAFLRLQLGDRRKFIESVLNLSIFSIMGEIANRQSSQFKTDMIHIKSAIDLLKEKVSITKTHLKDFERESNRSQDSYVKRIQSQVSTLEEEIDSIVQVNSELNSSKNDIQLDLNSLKKKEKSFLDLNSKLSIKYTQTLNRIKFFESNETCPTCDGSIDEKFREMKIANLTEKSNSIEFARSDLLKKINSINQTIQNLCNHITENQEADKQISMNQSLISQKRDMIESLRSTKNEEIDDIRNRIEQIKQSIQTLQTEYEAKLDERSSLLEKMECIEFIQSMTKDTGIRASIIKEYIPTIAQIMNTNLKRLGLFVRFELNESFEETLYAKGFEPIAYQALSEGEKQRIDIALVMTWREICKMQNNMAVDLIVFDEILDGSLDESGTENLIELFKSLSNEGTRVVVISHSTEKWDQFFSSSYSVEMKNGFSVLTEKSI